MARRRSYRWASVRFSIFGTYLDPAEVSDTLGIRPDTSAKRGDPLGASAALSSQQGHWSLVGHPSNGRIETQMTSILKQIDPVKTQLRELMSEHKHIMGAVVDIGYSPRQDLAVACFTLKSQRVEKFVELGIDVNISLYLPEVVGR